MDSVLVHVGILPEVELQDSKSLNPKNKKTAKLAKTAKILFFTYSVCPAVHVLLFTLHVLRINLPAHHPSTASSASAVR